MRCEASGVLVAKDKAIKRFIVRNIVDASAIRDIQDSSVIDGELKPCIVSATFQVRAGFASVGADKFTGRLCSSKINRLILPQILPVNGIQYVLLTV